MFAWYLHDFQEIWTCISKNTAYVLLGSTEKFHFYIYNSCSAKFEQRDPTIYEPTHKNLGLKPNDDTDVKFNPLVGA